MKNQVIILGGSSTNTLGVIRAFGRRGIPVSYVCTDSLKKGTSKSKYIKDIERFDNWSKQNLIEYFS